MFNTTVGSILFMFATPRLSAVRVPGDFQCPQSIAPLWCEHRVISDEARRRVLGGHIRPRNEIIALCRLWWLGHVLYMRAHHLPVRVLLARAGKGWKKHRGCRRTKLS